MNTKALEKFTILCKGVEWKEIKKAVDYLRSNGINVIKRKDDTADAFNYIRYRESRYEFQYYTRVSFNREVLTMPQDWDKLVSYVEEHKQENRKECLNEWVNGTQSMADRALSEIRKIKYPIFTNTLGDKFCMGDEIFLCFLST